MNYFERNFLFNFPKYLSCSILFHIVPSQNIAPSPFPPAFKPNVSISSSHQISCFLDQNRNLNWSFFVHQPRCAILAAVSPDQCSCHSDCGGGELCVDGFCQGVASRVVAKPFPWMDPQVCAGGGNSLIDYPPLFFLIPGEALFQTALTPAAGTSGKGILAPS